MMLSGLDWRPEWSEMSHLAEIAVSAVHVVPHCRLLDGDEPVLVKQLQQVPLPLGGLVRFRLAFSRTL